MKQSTHAKETRTLRSRRNQNRKDQSKRVRHLPGGHEAKAKAAPKVIAWGKHHTVAHPALQWERDGLLEVLWKTEDQRNLWIYGCNRYGGIKKNENRQRNLMKSVFDDYINTLKFRLFLLDEQISPIHEPTLQDRNS